jgi:hypothetical protein
LFWRVDPSGCRFFGWFGRFSDEALRVVAEGLIEGRLACGVDGVGLSVMDLVGCHEADAGVMVVAVVPVEEGPTERFGVFDAAEPFGELGLVFQGL